MVCVTVTRLTVTPCSLLCAAVPACIGKKLKNEERRKSKNQDAVEQVLLLPPSSFFFFEINRQRFENCFLLLRLDPVNTVNTALCPSLDSLKFEV